MCLHLAYPGTIVVFGIPRSRSPSQVLGSLLARSPSITPCRSRGAAEDGRSRCRISIPEGGRDAGDTVLAADIGRPMAAAVGAAALDVGASGDESSSPSQLLSTPPLRGGTRAAEVGRPPLPCCCCGEEGLRGTTAATGGRPLPAFGVVCEDAPPLLKVLLGLLPTTTTDGRAPPVDATEAAGRMPPAEEAVEPLLLLFGRAEAGRLDEPDISDWPEVAAPPRLPPPPPPTASISWSSSPP